MSKRDLTHICSVAGIRMERGDTIAVLRTKIVTELAGRKAARDKVDASWSEAVTNGLDPQGDTPPITRPAEVAVAARLFRERCERAANANLRDAAAALQHVTSDLLKESSRTDDQNAAYLASSVEWPLSKAISAIMPLIHEYAKRRSTDWGDQPVAMRQNLAAVIGRVLGKAEATRDALDDTAQVMLRVYDALEGWEPRNGRLRALPGYMGVAKVLDAMLEQAQTGKGRERHGHGGTTFESQKIHKIPELQDHVGGLVYQLCKKALEAEKMEPVAMWREALGIGVYAVALAGEAATRMTAHEKTPWTIKYVDGPDGGYMATPVETR